MVLVELVRPSVALAEPAYGVIPASLEISAWVAAGQEKIAAAPKINWNPGTVLPAADHIRPFPITYTTSAALEISGLTHAVASAAAAA